ncbi:AbrB/MazE/SpoVT family DNA-binding domain-containing protein [Candidatus Woesearchaeota archaeon]|nr:AbrB/MazE/SpoVT family DNA-binding domain-containing protein [Candidatus Woesearchaeota archaeon]
MVTIKMKVSQKGQIVIPKVLRDEYGINTESEVIMKDIGEGILIQKPIGDIAQGFRSLAQKYKRKINMQQIKRTIDEQYVERLRSAGL